MASWSLMLAVLATTNLLLLEQAVLEQALLLIMVITLLRSWRQWISLHLLQIITLQIGPLLILAR